MGGRMYFESIRTGPRDLFWSMTGSTWNPGRGEDVSWSVRSLAFSQFQFKGSLSALYWRCHVAATD